MFKIIYSDIKECTQTRKVCEKHCREIQGSYKCFCDSDEKLDENGYSCTSKYNIILTLIYLLKYIISYIESIYIAYNSVEECGHILVPSSVDQPSYTTSGGLRKATLSCSKPGHVFAGEIDPTPQVCIRGQWIYEIENYDIPGCQGKNNM